MHRPIASAALFKAERRDHHRRALIDFAQPVAVRDADIAPETGVDAFAVQRLDRLHFKSGLIERHQEHRQALMLLQAPCAIGRGSGEHQYIVGIMRAGGPKLLPVHQPIAIGQAFRAEGATEHVRACAGLGKAKAAKRVATNDARQDFGFGFLCSPQGAHIGVEFGDAD